MKKFIMMIIISVTLLVGGCNISNYAIENKSNIKSTSDGNNSSSYNRNVPTTVINTAVFTDTSNLSSLYSNATKATVTILNYVTVSSRGNTTTSLYSSGSGFIYNYDENYIYIYTNAHVVSFSSGYNQKYYEVVFYDGYRSYATLVYKDGSEDVAIMKVELESQDFAVASIGNSDLVSPGESVFTIGSPLGLDYANTITSGIVSNTNVSVASDNDSDGNSTTLYLIQIDASLNPGNSGGPLFNMKGEVIGVNTLKITSSDSGESVESFNFSIPINHFVKVANTLITDGSYSRPKLGITVIDVKNMSLETREEYGITVGKGIYIESVSTGGSSNGILQKGTIITKINGVVINDLADFSCELYKYLKGEKVEISVTSKTGENEVIYEIVLG